MRDQALAVEGSEVGLRVADVDREQHRRDYPGRLGSAPQWHGGKALRHPRLTPVPAAMLMLQRKGIPYKRVDLMPVISKGILRPSASPGTRSRPSSSTASGCRARWRSGGSSTGSSPSPPSIPPTPSSAPRSRRPRPGAMSSSRSRAGSVGGRSRRIARRWRATRRVRDSVSPSGSRSRPADRSWRSRRG